MCGRYTLSTPLDELVETFDVTDVVLDDYQPRYNVAPTQEAAVIVAGPGGRRLGALRWGLVPFWADSPAVGNRMINARSETVRERPAFREAFERRRCLVPADGFYEWKRLEDSPPADGSRRAAKARTRKVPYWIHRPDRRPFAFAGLWERWKARGGEGEREGEDEGLLLTFTILTTDANEALRPLHDRMPVVVPPEHMDVWLDREASPEALTRILGPAPDDLLEAWPVSTLVNSPDFDEPACIVPLVEG